MLDPETSSYKNSRIKYGHENVTESGIINDPIYKTYTKLNVLRNPKERIISSINMHLPKKGNVLEHDRMCMPLVSDTARLSI